MSCSGPSALFFNLVPEPQARSGLRVLNIAQVLGWRSRRVSARRRIRRMGPPTHRESHLPFGVLREMSRDRTAHLATDAGQLLPRRTGAIRPDAPITVSSPDGVVSRDLLRRLLRRLRICLFCVVLVGFV